MKTKLKIIILLKAFKLKNDKLNLPQEILIILNIIILTSNIVNHSLKYVYRSAIYLL